MSGQVSKTAVRVLFWISDQAGFIVGDTPVLASAALSITEESAAAALAELYEAGLIAPLSETPRAH